jgi:hypothetical protein
MIKEMTIDLDGNFNLLANVRMIADPPLDVLITYELFYWSARKPERKKLLAEFGTNFQDHDDFFWLVNPDNPSEGLASHEGRVIHVEAIVNSLRETEAEFSIALELYQENDHIVEGKTPIDVLTSELKRINIFSGDQFVTLRVVLKTGS